LKCIKNRKLKESCEESDKRIGDSIEFFILWNQFESLPEYPDSLEFIFQSDILNVDGKITVFEIEVSENQFEIQSLSIPYT